MMPQPRIRIASVLGAVGLVAVGLAALRGADPFWDSVLFSLTLGLLGLAALLAMNRAGERRAGGLGFALAGGSYLVLTLIPPVEARLLTTRGLKALHEANLLGIRALRLRFALDRDRMRASNVSADDVLKATVESRMIAPAEVVDGRVPPDARVEGATLIWDVRDQPHPDRYGVTILRASPEGNILRISDIARFEAVTPFTSYSHRWQRGTSENFNAIGHSLLALLAAGLGGGLSRWLHRVAHRPREQQPLARSDRP